MYGLWHRREIWRCVQPAFGRHQSAKEDTEYVEAIKEDIQWLGFKWGNIYHASDYFQQLWDSPYAS